MENNIPDTPTPQSPEVYDNKIPAEHHKWIAAPKAEKVCPYTNLKHAKFYQEFCYNRSIRQVRTGVGKQRGKRLFWLPDIYSFLMKRAEDSFKQGGKEVI